MEVQVNLTWIRNHQCLHHLYQTSNFTDILRPLYETHIITCSLMAAKIKEWKHIKIVRPEASINPASSASYSPRPLLVIYPGTYKDAARVPGYAAHTPNSLASA